ncbi:MAG: helix-turn-helix domain-containing protein [Pseudobdellovibrionaceae bacterium]
MAEFHHLGAYLKQKRTDAGYTQVELAEKLGDIHSQFVSNWERGLCAPPGHSLPRLVDILKLSRERLVEVMVQDSRAGIMAKIYKKKAKSNKKTA